MKGLMDFVWFVLAIEFIVNLLSGDFWSILILSNTGNAGTALAQLLFLVGFIMTIRFVINSIKNRK